MRVILLAHKPMKNLRKLGFVLPKELPNEYRFTFLFAR
jgi:hypothetical protein